jgi:glucokinase
LTPTYLGIEIGGTKLQLVLGNEKAQILHRFRFVVDRHAGTEAISRHIAEPIQSFQLNVDFAI